MSRYEVLRYDVEMEVRSVDSCRSQFPVSYIRCIEIQILRLQTKPDASVRIAWLEQLSTIDEAGYSKQIESPATFAHSSPSKLSTSYLKVSYGGGFSFQNGVF